MFGVFVNVGSNSLHPNGRGRVFSDGSFEYLPIPEREKTIEKVPTYGDLGFVEAKYPELRVHVDPEFDTFTYGHFSRGFGDVKSLLRLEKRDVLFFYATLQRESGWEPYVIGYFFISQVRDCRKMSHDEIRSLKRCGFGGNAHLKRVDPSVDFLIKGAKRSRLLRRAFRLSEEGDHLKFRRSLKDLILTSSGRKIQTGKPWFRMDVKE